MLYTADPGFVDMANADFTLKPDAQLFKDFPGFPDIPFKEIGPQAASGAPTNGVAPLLPYS